MLPSASRGIAQSSQSASAGTGLCEGESAWRLDHGPQSDPGRVTLPRPLLCRACCSSPAAAGDKAWLSLPKLPSRMWDPRPPVFSFSLISSQTFLFIVVCPADLFATIVPLFLGMSISTGQPLASVRYSSRIAALWRESAGRGPGGLSPTSPSPTSGRLVHGRTEPDRQAPYPPCTVWSGSGCVKECFVRALVDLTRPVSQCSL